MARIRRRGYVPVLCASVARNGVRQIEPAEDHRRWHRLAVPKRAQTRAKGVGESKGGSTMLITQTRRRFLATGAMAGGAVLLRAPPAPAGQGALETTTVRLPHKPT